MKKVYKINPNKALITGQHFLDKKYKYYVKTTLIIEEIIMIIMFIQILEFGRVN